jgi:hypothetical protein
MTRNEKIGYTTVFTALFAGAAFFIAGPVVALAAAFCVPMLSFLINKFQNRKRIVVPATVEETNTAIADASAPTTEKSPKNNNTAAPTVEPTSKAIETPANPASPTATAPESVVPPVVAPATPTKAASPTTTATTEPAAPTIPAKPAETQQPPVQTTPESKPEEPTKAEPQAEEPKAEEPKAAEPKAEPQPENPEPAATKPADNTAKGETPPAPNADNEDPREVQKRLEASRMDKGNPAANPPKQEKTVELTEAQKIQANLAAKRAKREASNNPGAEPPKLEPKPEPKPASSPLKDAWNAASNAVLNFLGAKPGEGELKKGTPGPTSSVLARFTSPTTSKPPVADGAHSTPEKVPAPVAQVAVITLLAPATSEAPEQLAMTDAPAAAPTALASVTKPEAVVKPPVLISSGLKKSAAAEKLAPLTPEQYVEGFAWINNQIANELGQNPNLVVNQKWKAETLKVITSLANVKPFETTYRVLSEFEIPKNQDAKTIQKGIQGQIQDFETQMKAKKRAESLSI